MAMRTSLLAISLMTLACATYAQKANRPTPPTRDPHAAGFVQATELPDAEVPSPTAPGNFILGPTHPRSPLMPTVDAPLAGTVVEFTLSSTESKYFPGIERDPDLQAKPDPQHPGILMGMSTHPQTYTRKVVVYVPKGYVPGNALPLIVGADGPDQMLLAALDGLIAAGKLPPTAAVSIGNGGGDSTGSERGLEYDTVSGRYAEFVEHEVLPRAMREANVTFTNDPRLRATMGGSSGGSAALAMAWFHPEWFGLVLTYSGTYVNQQWPHNNASPHGAFEFAEHLIPFAPRKQLRLWMEVGDHDLLNPNAMRDGMHDWVDANERMAGALAAKGYAYQFLFARNAGHVDRSTKAETLPEALLFLFARQ